MKRKAATALIVVLAVLVATLALRWAARPETAGPRMLDMAGRALGLEISADRFDYRLRDGPRLVAHGVSVSTPGAPEPMIEAGRILVAVPWSTLRGRGGDSTITRVELDSPRVALEPFLQWWSQRPPGDGALVTLREGLWVEGGRIDAGAWSLQDIAIDLPHFAPDARLAASVRGHYEAAGLQVDFDLQMAMSRPAAGAGVGAAGTLTPRTASWRLPSRLVFSARLGPAGGPFLLHRLRLSSHSRYTSAEAAQSFALGLAGEGAFNKGALTVQPVAVALRGRGMIPSLRAAGRFILGEPLEFQLDGRIEHWPEAWPPLPPPIDEPGWPLTLSARYHGNANLSAPAELSLARGDALLETRLLIGELASWISDVAAGSPLPPLSGRLMLPQVDVAGASLHGVEVSIQHDSSEAGEEP